MSREIFWCALGTEVVRVCLDSVVAVVRTGNHDRQELSLGPRELGRPEHDGSVETHRRTEYGRVERHRLDDVEDLPRARDGRLVLLLKRTSRFALVDQLEIGHGADSALERGPNPSYKLHAGPGNAISVALPSTEGERVGDSEDAGTELETGQIEEKPANDAAAVGSRVAGVLEAAETAAEQIRSDALREAHETMRRAEGDAQARIEELTREAERVRAEADDYARDIRQAVDSYGTQARREADEEARKVVTEAEEQARAVREAAQSMAEQIQSDAHRRDETLQREAKVLEDRRQRVLDSLRDLVAQLQDALVEPSRGEEESLVEALDVERRH
jgi:FtsZ-binding cell division protein ZapB